MRKPIVLVVGASSVVLGVLGIAFLSRDRPIEAQANEVLAGYSILVEIDGIAGNRFRGCEGLAIDTQIIEFREGGDVNTVRKIPGVTSWGNLVLKFGPGELANELWEWHTTVLAGAVDKRNMSVVLVNEKEGEVVRYNLQDAWPARWEGPRQVATSTAIPIESVTLACERITRFGQ